ncbi:peptidoglycan-associated lipoprotein Pal [bacterium]|nr:peptidoglycan-associated lipoprotein Pal [bacterium]
MKSKHFAYFTLLALLLASLALTPGCKKKMPKESAPPSKTEEITPVEEGTEGTATDRETRDEMERDMALVHVVYFDFDRSEIRAGEREKIRNNADILRKWTDWTVTLEGHCDERGTNEYNLALGERRAKAALRAMEAEGISGARFETISYGEERPSDPGHEESNWSRNRRVEFRVKMNTPESRN